MPTFTPDSSVRRAMSKELGIAKSSLLRKLSALGLRNGEQQGET